MSVDERLVVVRSLAAELGALELRAQLLRERLYDAVREAAVEGATQDVLGEAAGVSRQRITQLVNPGYEEERRRTRAKAGRPSDA